MATITQREFIARHCNAPDRLARAVIRQIGGWDAFKESALDSALDFEVESNIEYFTSDECDQERRILADACAVADAVWRVADWSIAHGMIARDYLERFADAMNEHCDAKPDCGFALDFELVNSPKEYNFTSDRLFAFIDETAAQFMLDNTSPGTLADAIRERHTSRSGFISFYSCNPQAWNKPISQWDHNELETLLIAFLNDCVDRGDELDGAAKIERETVDAMHYSGIFWESADAAIDWDQVRETAQQVAA